MKLLKALVNCIFVFILFLIVTGGFRLSFAGTVYELSRVGPFVLLLWLLIALYYLAWRLLAPKSPSLNGLFPFQATDFLHRKPEEADPETVKKIRLILVAIFSVILIVCSIFKYYSFNAYMWDLGFFDNLLWNTANGNFYRVATVLKPYQNVLGDHIHPILLLFVPLYKLHPSPLWLLFFQPIIVAIGAYGVYRLAYAILYNRSFAFLFFLAFLLYLPLRNGILFDFHESCFFPPVYIWMLVFYFERRYRPAAALFVLSFTIKETAALYNAVLLTSVFLTSESRKHKVLCGVLAAFSLLIFFLEVQVWIPYFRGGAEYEYAHHYRSIGGSPSGIFLYALQHPVAFVKHIATPERLVFIAKILVPLGFLSLFSLRGALIVAVPLILFVLPDDPKIFSTDFLFHYGLAVAPFVFVSAMLGLKNVWGKLPKVPVRALFFLILWCSLAFYGHSDIRRIRWFMPDKDDLELHAFLKDIPEEKSIRAYSNFVPHFSHRNSFAGISWTNPAPAEEDYYIIPSAWLNKPEVKDGVLARNYELVREINDASIFTKSR